MVWYLKIMEYDILISFFSFFKNPNPVLIINLKSPVKSEDIAFHSTKGYNPQREA
jgi:hypothetical protein